MKFKLNKLKIYQAVQIRFFFTIASLLVLAAFVPAQQVSSAEIYSLPLAEDRKPIRVIKVIATAYSSDPAQTDDTPCIPADGYDLCKHYETYGEGNTLAANFLPLGSQVKLPDMFGDKVFVVHDRMNARYGYGRIDIWMPTKEEAQAFGVRQMELEMYGGHTWRMVMR